MTRDMIGSALGADIVAENLEKATEVIRTNLPEGQQPVSWFWDPMSLFMGREWLVKRNPSALTFHDLRRMAATPIIAAIIQTRLNQAASFMRPSTGTFDPGFRIISDDDDAMKDTEKIKAITQWVGNCGIPELGDSSLEVFARKVLRDSLVLDQLCAEVVFRRNDLPAYLVAVDGATVRRLKRSLERFVAPQDVSDPFYVQVVNDRIVAEYGYNDLIYGIRNPQTNIQLLGYGVSELEYLIRTVSTMVNADKFNASVLSQGGINKGLLVVKKPPERGQFEAFKRDFREAYRNAARVWQPPVLGVPEGAEIDWVRLDEAQRDMEYAQLFDFLVKESCGVYQIDPVEVNWSIGATGQRTTFESRQNDKTKASQRKGLKPLLDFFADCITHWGVRHMDDRFRMEFVGVGVDRKELADVQHIEVTTTRTLNEVRGDRGDPELPGGDIVLNPEYLKALLEVATPSEMGDLDSIVEGGMVEVEADEDADDIREDVVEEEG
jgi:hypothetical protein